jgi:hypothetical protein
MGDSILKDGGNSSLKNGGKFFPHYTTSPFIISTAFLPLLSQILTYDVL